MKVLFPKLLGFQRVKFKLFQKVWINLLFQITMNCKGKCRLF